jgi:hypothetical protein
MTKNRLFRMRFKKELSIWLRKKQPVKTSKRLRKRIFAELMSKELKQEERKLCKRKSARKIRSFMKKK